jgi:hypothetical protein
MTPETDQCMPRLRLPWTTDGEGGLIDKAGFHLAEFVDEEDALLSARAVNCHEELVKVVRGALNITNGNMPAKWIDDAKKITAKSEAK